MYRKVKETYRGTPSLSHTHREDTHVRMHAHNRFQLYQSCNHKKKLYSQNSVNTVTNVVCKNEIYRFCA